MRIQTTYTIRWHPKKDSENSNSHILTTAFSSVNRWYLLLWPNILSFVEKVFKVLVLIASWISQRDKSNKQPQQALINGWLQLGLPLYIVYMRELPLIRTWSSILRLPYYRRIWKQTRQRNNLIQASHDRLIKEDQCRHKNTTENLHLTPKHRIPHRN